MENEIGWILSKPVSSHEIKEPLKGFPSSTQFVLIRGESTLKVFMLPTTLDFAAGVNSFLLINTNQTLTWQLLLKDLVSSLAIHRLNKSAQANNMMLCIAASSSSSTHTSPNLAFFQPEF